MNEHVRKAVIEALVLSLKIHALAVLGWESVLTLAVCYGARATELRAERHLSELESAGAAVKAARDAVERLGGDVQ